MSDHVGIISRGRMVWQGPLTQLHAQARGWLELRTTDDERAAALLGVAWSGERSIRLATCSDEKLAQLVLLLAREGIAVLRLEEHREDLEDLFLKLTGTEASL